MNTNPTITSAAPVPGPVVRPPVYDIVAAVLMGIALIAALPLGLLSALLGGLLVYHVTESLVPFIARIGIRDTWARSLIVLFIASVVIGGCALLTVVFAAKLTGGPGSIAALLRTLADIVEGMRNKLPESLQAYIPPNFEELTRAASRWFRDNALQVSQFGRRVVAFLIQTLVGMIIGGLLVFARHSHHNAGPLAAALNVQVGRLSNVFRHVVLAQIRISALNTLFTSVFLLWGMPALGFDLPAVHTLIAVTFIAGLLPVAGNLISNTVITLVSLSVSPIAAAVCLGYLMAIHKLEYFFNAKIIGTRVGVKAWEMLTAMLVMEAAFGVPGLVAAPIYYSYLKDELRARRLI